MYFYKGEKNSDEIQMRAADPFYAQGGEKVSLQEYKTWVLHVRGWLYAEMCQRVFLDSFETGESQVMMSVRSLKKIMDKMKLCPNDIFLDVGCGCGIACLLACLVYNCRAAIGIDCNEHAIKQAARYAKDVSAPCKYICKDVCDIAPYLCFRTVTAVYAFDEAFSIVVKDSIETHLFPLLTRARVYALNGLRPSEEYEFACAVRVKAYRNNKYGYSHQIWFRG